MFLQDIKVEFSRQKQKLENENIKSLLDYSRKELQFEVINDDGNKSDKLKKLINELKDTESFIETTEADAALMVQLGAEGVFVGSGIFKSGDPAKRAAAIVKAVKNYDKPEVIAEVSENLGEAIDRKSTV